ncbi:MAG: hypothetical protein ABMB14_27130 [Myxococcota bacterium]
MTLSEAVADPGRRDAIVADCVRLVDDEVRGKSGLTGAAVRAGYAAFQRVKPGIVRAAVIRLLPEMAPALEGHWTASAAGGGADRYFRANDRRIAEDLLTVTDRLAARSTNRVLTKLYGSLRPSAVTHVVAAVPRIPALLRAHLPDPGPLG